MDKNRRSMFCSGMVAVVALIAALLLAMPAQVAAQATISTGSIQGTISDPKGGVVPDARITVTNKASGHVDRLTTTQAGTFNAGTLTPGDYTVRVEVKGFKTSETTVRVEVGVITPLNLTLELGAESTVVNVEATAITVNTQQATVQDVITAAQIEDLPVNGRNFLDLASLEPGVQIQDGATFDPTKNGFSSISFGGRAGRTARIELDGLDISDETVGTTTQNVPQSAIQEFNVSQSTLDLSTELTSSGTVNIATRSGGNAVHGQAYYYGRSDKSSAKIAPQQLNFGRNQYGGNFGGAFIKDKLFYFLDGERTAQTLASPVQLAAPFTALSGSFNSPFHETEYVAKMDWNIRGSWKAFYRFSFDQNLSVRGFNPGVYQPFANVDHTPVHAMGTDFTKGRFTNSFRVGYMKFRNAIADATTSGVLNPAPGISLMISPGGVGDLTCLAGGEAFCSGTNILAPQATYQSNKQGKYDGSFAFKSHILRYGIGVNRILGGGFAKFFGIAPAVNATFPGSAPAVGASNPLNWPAENVLLGNGQGFFTEIPQFGLPAGGQFDTRFTWYVGDSWRATHRFTVSYGVHYVRDTGRSDSDLAAIPALNQFGAGFGNQVHQPNKNFSPQLGIAWDPTGGGKTVIRAGSGIFYENAIFNNVLFDRPARLQRGLFFGTKLACLGGNARNVSLPGGGIIVPTFCGQPIGTVVNQIIAFQKQYQAAVLAAGPQANGAFVGNTLAEGVDATGDQLLAPNYRSPYSFQLNGGIQHQFGKGTVLTVDYVRNVGLHYLLGIDTNHTGAARFLDRPAALAAISATNGSFAGCGATATAADINCAIAHGATIADYAGNGLDSGVTFNGGSPCGPGVCAFPGANPNLGENQMLFPIGRSVYNGMLVSLKSRLDSPVRGMRHLDLITSYALSRFKSQAADQDFITNSVDFDNPGSFFGPSALDRTHNLGVGAVMDFPGTTRFALSTHWATAPPLTLTLPRSGNPGEIFLTDVTGDGTTGDVVPGTNIGSFDRSVKASGINGLINSYNSSSAGKLTPAGQALVTSGLFTQAQLVALGAVTPSLSLAPNGQVGASPRFTTDMYVSWRLHPNKVFHGLAERVVVEPQIAMFNVFNFQNYDPGGNILSGVLNGAPGSANGTTAHDQAGCATDPTKCTGRTNKVTPGSSSGVNWYGVPRQWQFGVKMIF
ncbi:MAG TPA: carboxypeptidase regulatory-like domain-containing protein [Candidatus Acidoferrales bacterium]|nr:carboxypeptidase regulatory-like domain-containing protein [Candidatus Acidoferrales bacterium]